MNKEIEDFVTDEKGFVNPEKIAAIDLYGFEKAKELWDNKEPDWSIRQILQKKSLSDFINS